MDEQRDRVSYRADAHWSKEKCGGKNHKTFIWIYKNNNKWLKVRHCVS